MLDIKIRPYISSDYNYICDIHDAARKMELSLASLDVAFLPFSLAAERENFFDYPHIDVAIMNQWGFMFKKSRRGSCPEMNRIM